MLRRSLLVAAALIGLGVQSNVVLAQTLVAQYQFANAGNLGLDSSLFANNATNANVTQGLDRFGALSAGNFNGANSVLTKPGSLTGFDGLPGFTYSAWINRSAAQSGTYGGIVSQDPSGNGNVVNRLLLNPSDNPFFDAGAHADATAATALPDGVWSHLVMSADDTGPGSTVRVYLNGALIGTQNYGHDLANSAAFDTFVGAGENGNVWFFQGLLDDVRIYDGAVSAQQASNLFQFGQLEVPEPASIAVWSLAGLGLTLFGILRRRAK